MKELLGIDFVTLQEQDSFFHIAHNGCQTGVIAKTVPKGYESKPSDVKRSVSFLSTSHLLVTAT